LGDKAIVILNGDENQQKLTSGYLFDLALCFDRIRAVVLPSSPAVLASSPGVSAERLHELLTTARPLMTYRIGARAAAEPIPDREPPDRGLDL
jgi:hypothetical protein